MNGFKTLVWNGLLVAAGAVLPWLGGVQWTDYVSPTAATLIVAGVNVVLRIITTGPILGTATK
jgi:hypothetical protein